MTPDAESSPVVEPIVRRRRGLLVWLALSALLLGAGASAAPEPELRFERHELVTGSTPPQTVLTGFLLGGGTAELAVLHVTGSGERRLRVFALGNDGWRPAIETTLDREVLFVDLARIGGRDRLIVFRRGRLSWIDLEAGEERQLLELAAGFRVTDETVIPHVDVTRDLNGDGLDDLVVPGVDGFWVSTQRRDGAFREAVRLGPPEPFRDAGVGKLDAGEGASGGPRTYGELGVTAATAPVYLGRVHRMDYDRDGRVDLVFWDEDHFEVHLQDERGRFDPVARSFTTEVAFDADGAYAHAFRFSDRGVLATVLGLGKRTTTKVLHSLRDLDGDGVADLVTLTLSGRSLVRQESLYEVHPGAPVAAGTVFSPRPAAVIRPRGRAGGLEPWGYSSREYGDFDGDGRADLLFRDVPTGIGSMLRTLTGNSVPVDLELYRAGEGGFPERATIRRRIRRFAPFAGPGNIFFPPVLVGDVNGDGRADLVAGKGPDELHVFLGVPGPELLARRPLELAVELPPDERRSRLVDLDRDGRLDLLVHHAPTARTPGSPHRLTTLIVR